MTLLLFDHNLSPRLVDRLSAVFPGSIHVSTVGLAEVSDREVWDYARENGYVLTTKDADFSELGVVWGFPPKTVWIRRGNCSTGDMERLLRDNAEAITALSDDPETGVLALF